LQFISSGREATDIAHTHTHTHTRARARARARAYIYHTFIFIHTHIYMIFNIDRRKIVSILNKYYYYHFLNVKCTLRKAKEGTKKREVEHSNGSVNYNDAGRNRGREPILVSDDKTASRSWYFPYIRKFLHPFPILRFTLLAFSFALISRPPISCPATLPVQTARRKKPNLGPRPCK